MAITKFSSSGMSVGSGVTKYDDFLAGNPPYIPSSYESIATFTGSGTPNNVTFSSIPSTYKNLQLRMLVNCSAGVGIDDLNSMRIAFNADATAANYYEHYLRGNGTAAQASSQAGTTGGFYMGTVAGGTLSASYFAVTIIDILDYASTSKNKTARSFTGGDANTSGGAVALQSGGWFSTAAISSIKILFGGNLTAASSIALYGIKG